jgi:uncharacterized membrane protein
MQSINVTAVTPPVHDGAVRHRYLVERTRMNHVRAAAGLAAAALCALALQAG